MKSLSGKAAVVTGSTSGIGAAIARALASEGAAVMLNGLGEADAIEKQRADLEAEFGVEVAYNGADMAKPAEIAAMIRDAETRFGKVDIVVNNAAIQHVAPVDEFPIEKWDAIIAIDLSSSFHTMRAAVPGMKRRGFGRIVNIASAHSVIASPYKTAYVAAKHGLVGLTKSAAVELATTGITVNCVSPGYVWTPLVEKQIPDTMRARNMTEEQVKRDVLLRAQPTNRFVEAEEIARMVVHLCSEAAASIVGSNIIVDGGWSVQ